jgi:hypothetical protein
LLFCVVYMNYNYVLLPSGIPSDSGRFILIHPTRIDIFYIKNIECYKHFINFICVRFLKGQVVAGPRILCPIPD